MPTDASTDVCIMIGHDDDVVLDPRLHASRPRNATSRWEGKQSDMAIAESMLAQFPQLKATFARTNEELLATDAKVQASPPLIVARARRSQLSRTGRWCSSSRI